MPLSLKALRSSLWTIVLTALVTLVCVLIAVNLTIGEQYIKRPIAHDYSVRDPQFARSMGILLGPLIVSGNRFQALLNGDEIFPSMLRAVRGAQQTITFETYIYWSGNVGREFAEALAERARADVSVHVLIDWVGSDRMDKNHLETMQRAGVDVRRFHKPRWYDLTNLNNRTHRKLLVVDGVTGYTGGVGIADQWSGHAQDLDHWRDSFFKVEGPVVAQMQAVFADNWLKAAGVALHGAHYFPLIPNFGDGYAQMFASSPDGGSQDMELMYLLIIAATTQSIDLSMAYFIPDAIARDTIVEALKRGVRVRIITPGPTSDVELARRASRSLWGDVLLAGAEIYEYQPTMYHVKAMIADNFVVSVGSTNFDDRSFHLNDEATLNIYDQKFARQQTQIFEHDLAQSRRITYDEWRSRPLTEKLWEKAIALLAPQL